MKKIYINEPDLFLFKEEAEKEVTFYEFFVNAKNFLKDLLNKPADAKPSELFTSNGIGKKELLSKMKDIGLIKSDEKITEVPVEEAKTHPFGKKMVAKHFISYKIPRSRFEDKMHELYKQLFEVKSVFKDENKAIRDIKNMDSDNAYKERGGFKEMVEEDGAAGVGGATSCGNVMQGGGTNPDAGQFMTPISPVQRRKFYEPTLKRNKDEKNGSISMNKKK